MTRTALKEQMILREGRHEMACFESHCQKKKVPQETKRQQVFLTVVMKVHDETQTTTLLTLSKPMHQHATKCIKDLL